MSAVDGQGKISSLVRTVRIQGSRFRAYGLVFAALQHKTCGGLVDCPLAGSRVHFGGPFL